MIFDLSFGDLRLTAKPSEAESQSTRLESFASELGRLFGEAAASRFGRFAAARSWSSAELNRRQLIQIAIPILTEYMREQAIAFSKLPDMPITSEPLDLSQFSGDCD